MEFLMKTVITTEISESFSAYEYLHNSISKTVFEWYTKFSAATWLAQSWGKYIADICVNNIYFEVDQETQSAGAEGGHVTDISGNRDKLKRLCFLFIESILQALGKCPRPLLEFASILADYTSQDPLQFIFVNFFALALDAPEEYGLVLKKPARPASRTLAQISEMIINIGNNTDFLLPKIPMDREERQKFVDRIEDWMEEEPEDQPPGDTDTIIPWPTEREALMNLTDYILENQDIIDSELKTLGTVQHNISFGLLELIETLNPPPMPPEKGRPLSRTKSGEIFLGHSISPRGGSEDFKREKKKIFSRKKRH